MGIQKSIASIAKLGYWLDILIDEQGMISAGIYSVPHHPSGMTTSILNPAIEQGKDLEEVLSSLMKRLLKQMKEQGNA